MHTFPRCTSAYACVRAHVCVFLCMMRMYLCSYLSTVPMATVCLTASMFIIDCINPRLLKFEIETYSSQTATTCPRPTQRALDASTVLISDRHNAHLSQIAATTRIESIGDNILVAGQITDSAGTLNAIQTLGIKVGIVLSYACSSSCFREIENLRVSVRERQRSHNFL